MKKGQVCEGIVRRVDFPNKGIVETDEGTAVVKTGLPGQKVKFIVNKMKNGKAEGRLLEVLEKSLWRQVIRVPILDCVEDVVICPCLMRSSLR